MRISSGNARSVRAKSQFRLQTFCAIFALVFFGAWLAGCGANSPAVSSLSVSLSKAQITSTGTDQATATATYSNTKTADVTTTATWSSSSPDVATVSPTGLITAIKKGQTTITATLGTVTGTAPLTAVATLKTIAVTPVGVTVRVTATQQYAAMGTYDDASTGDITSTVAWSTSDSTLATISSTGLLTGVKSGAVTVSASLTGVTGTAAVTIGSNIIAAVHKAVVDQVNVGLNNLQVSFSTATAPVSTDAHGNFQIQTAPGSNLLTITNQGQTLLSQTVTVNADGTIVEFPGAIQITVPLGGSNETKTPIVAARPPLNLTPTMPYGGQSVTVAFSDVNAQSVSAQFTGAGCGGLINGSLTGTSYTQTAQVANAGGCQIVATVQYAGGPQVFQSQFLVRPTHITLPALSIIGGDFVPGDSLPAAVNLTGAVAVTGSTGPGKLVNGAIARIFVQSTDSAAKAGIVRIQVGVHGSAGYFTVPAQLSNGQMYFDIALDQDYFTAQAPGGSVSTAVRQLTHRGRSGARASETPTDLMLDIQTVDNQGNTSQPDTSSFSLQQVGSGTLQISLAWGTPDDLDLHVVEPSGNEIYYGTPTSSDGGVLDLDSNPACEIDNIDTENVTWPNASAKPPKGTYIVRADYYESCSGLAPAYQVTVNNCGNVSQFTGSFAANADDGGSAGAGFTVSTFQFNPCGAAEVSGLATYDDLAQTPTGLATTPTEMPVRYADVEVHRVSDDTVLGTGTTDGAGSFDVTFTNTGTPGYYVKLIASGSDHVIQEVRDASGADWFLKSSPFDETVTPTNTGVNLHALTTDSAPAFNVYDLGVEGTAMVKRYFRVAPTKLIWIYFYAQAPPPCPSVSCFTGANDTIYVNGGPADPDVYDDLVLLHEYGHFVQKYFSADHSAGGLHMLTGQYAPTLAWSEGSATFFGLFTRQTSEYLDTTAAGIGIRYDVTIPISATVAALGTADQTQTGFLSEVMPTAGMWAMAVTDNNPVGVFAGMGAVKGVLVGSGSARDFTGADFIDFLDGWFCTGNDLNAKLKVQINQRLLIPYDYAPQNVTNFCTAVFPDVIFGVTPVAQPLTANPGGIVHSTHPKKKP